MATTSEFIGGPQELHEYLGKRIPLRTIYGWRTKGSGPRGYKIGKHVLYKKADVEHWLEGQSDPRPAA